MTGKDHFFGKSPEIKFIALVFTIVACIILAFYVAFEAVQQLSTISNTVLLVPYAHTTSKSRKHTSKNPRGITQ
ncbi:MAG: hypothetical protein ACXQT2_00600, partial [Methanotrichaceae archaeon]